MNVVQIKDLIKNEMATSTMRDFAQEAGINSEKTAMAYYSDLNQYMEIIFGTSATKAITTERVAKTINRVGLQKYRKALIDRKLASSTINRKMTVVSEFAKHLYKLGYEVDINATVLLKDLKVENNSYEVITLEEANKIIDWVKTNEKRNAINKYYYFVLAFDTGVRANALNNLTPASFIVKDKEVMIKGVDKGKKTFVKSISVELYYSMVADLKIDEMESDQKIFHYTEPTRHNIMKRALEGLGWSNRNITFHSFKKGAVTHAYDVTKDILLAQKVGSHSSLVTTQRYLADSEEVFQGAFSSKSTVETNNIKFSDFTKEQLIEALMKVNEGTQIEVKKQLFDQM